MSTNRLLPVVIPQTGSFSLVSPYGSLDRLREIRNNFERIMFTIFCLMIPEEAFMNGVTHQSILNDMGIK